MSNGDKFVSLRNLGIELSKVRNAMEFFLARGEHIMISTQEIDHQFTRQKTLFK